METVKLVNASQIRVMEAVGGTREREEQWVGWCVRAREKPKE